MGITIIIKGKGKDGQDRKATYKDFYGPLDKGSAKPSFCYPRMKDAMKEDVDSMKRNLEHGFIDKTKEMQVRADMKVKEKRLKELDAQESEARKLFKEGKDDWMKRREDLAEEIKAAMPSSTDVAKRRTNPYRIMQDEKQRGLGEKKKEFQILSHLADEESNTSFLQRD
jgi:gas vesicle protein